MPIHKMLTIADLIELNDGAWNSMMSKLASCKHTYEQRILENLAYLNEEKKLLERVKCLTTQ